jgi:hypothetical protein
VGVGQQILEYSSLDGSLDESMFIILGEQTYATVNFETTLKNNSWWWKDVILTLPPDTNQQQVQMSSIEPKPSSLRIDRDGNIVSVYRIGPQSSRKVKAVAQVVIKSASYDLKSADGSDKIDTSLVANYTKLTDNWQPIGIEVVLKGDENSAQKVQAVYEAVLSKAKADRSQDAAGLSVSERNNSLKYTDWLVGELRSRGIPARAVLGLTMSNGDYLNGPHQHAWAEGYVAGVGWITLDPWLGTYGDSFGVADPLRLALAVWGIEDNKPPVDLGIANINFNDKAEAVGKEVITVTAKRYVFLPFVAITNIQTQRGSGGIVDQVVLRTDKGDIVMGSQSPFQNGVVRYLTLGLPSFSSSTVSFGSDISGEFEPWVDQAQVTVSYLPLIILLGVLLIWFVGGRLYHRFRGHRSSSRRSKASKEALTLHDEAVGGDIEIEDLIPNPPAYALSPPARGQKDSDESSQLPDHKQTPNRQIRVQ